MARTAEVALIFDSLDHLKSEWTSVPAWRRVAAKMVIAGLFHGARCEEFWLDMAVAAAGRRALDRAREEILG